MKSYGATLKDLKTISLSEPLRHCLFLLLALVLVSEIITLTQVSGADFRYSLCALAILLGLGFSLYKRKPYIPYFLSAGLVLSTLHLPQSSFNAFHIFVLIGLPFGILLANYQQTVVLGVSALLFFFDGLGKQELLNWLVGSIGFYLIFFLFPLALRLTWEQKQTTVQEYDRYRQEAEESKRALARELHDTLARHISITGLATQQGLEAQTLADKNKALGTIEESSHKTLVDLRLLIRATRGEQNLTQLPETSAATLNLKETLAQARQALQQRGFTLDEKISIKTADLPEGIQPTFHKLIQEIRYNAEKYATPGSTITIRAKPSLTGVTVTTSNPVKAHKTTKKQGTGYGLVGISERIRALGGTICYGEKDGTWSLTIHLPLAITPESPKSWTPSA